MFLGLAGLVGIIVFTLMICGVLMLLSYSFPIILGLIALIFLINFGILREVIILIAIGAVIKYLFMGPYYLGDQVSELINANQRNRKRKRFIQNDAPEWLAVQHIPVMDAEKVNSYLYTMVKSGNQFYPTPSLNDEMNLFISSELQTKEAFGELDLEIHRLEIVRCQVAATLKIYLDIDEKNKCLVKPK